LRITALVTLCVASLLANPYPEPDPSGIGMGVLTLWPTARSTALAGTMTGLADEADATYYDPAGLAFQTSARATVNAGERLPGLYPGMYHAFAAGGSPLRLPFLHGRSAYLAGSLTYMTVGETDIVNEHGDFIGRMNVWRGVAAAHGATQLTKRLAIGISLKLLQSVHQRYYDWMWDLGTDVGLETGGNATAVAADVGLSYRPSSKVSFGLSTTNVGPRIRYYPDNHYGVPYSAALPSMARLGLCWTPVEYRKVRLRLMPELDKVLVGMFSDTTGESFNRQLDGEWKDVWKALGVEVTAFNLVALRLGYFEDLTNQRGGLLYEKERWNTEHYGIWDVLTRKHLGTLKRIGLCWGFGIGTDKLRFDFSSDAAIYDFPTSNWKFQLTCNNIGGLFCGRS